jgi:hypothetical protein
MLDADKYAEHFPDERPSFSVQDTKCVSVSEATTPSPLLLAALSRLEREFSDILQAQNPVPSNGSD